jgi:hypothetical protein
MEAILISLFGAVLKGIFSLIGISMDNSAKSEAEARKKETEGILDTVDAERAIADRVKEVERDGVKPEDIFAPELPVPDLDPVL